MKRFALLSILILAGCQASPINSPDPQVPTVILKKSPRACELVHWTQVDAQDRPAGSRQAWDLYIKFYTTCDSDVNVKVYFVYPIPNPGSYPLDGRLKPIGDADAVGVVDTEHPDWTSTFRMAQVQWILPKDMSTWEWPAFPDSWNPKFFVEVRSGGTLIGSFTTVNDGTPD